MNGTSTPVALLAALAALFSLLTAVHAVRPMFVESLKNLTVPIGRDATFTCVVRHLGGYRVGWVKADSKAIQAIHTHVITHNPRVRVSHRDQTTWNLHINQVQEEDRGTYMCQINYDPMMSQYGVLEVVVPPDIISDQSSGDLTIPEGGSGELRCKARGYPTPVITWRREDGRPIAVSRRQPSGGDWQNGGGWRDVDGVLRQDGAREPPYEATEYRGEVLPLDKVRRSDTGYYLCIASNGLPPSVSKKIKLEVHFHPVVQVPTQLIGVPLWTDVTLRCHVEALPKSINYWNKEPGGPILIANDRLNITEERDTEYSLWMTLTIHTFDLSDAGDYVCTAKNSIGEVQSTIQVYAEIRPREPGTPAAEVDTELTYQTPGEEQAPPRTGLERDQSRGARRDPPFSAGEEGGRRRTAGGRQRQPSRETGSEPGAGAEPVSSGAAAAGPWLLLMVTALLSSSLLRPSVPDRRHW
ncbi:lachesin-like isoform X1 [Amphibalanus amphitrite]|uniref:lachesin-like isoform X1 n=1 Tax=Amphibalanus amphitrite TaxID=1232801 RepID=UPI001C910880|nr:lachesin-like isoform X1 [Amphibalanus amphitrite]